MALIGLISDTHGYLDPQIKDIFSDCEEIWHLGDIGSLAVLDELKKLKPIKAVYGNIDEKEIQWKCKEIEIIHLEGLSFLLIHIAGSLPQYNKQVRDILSKHKIDVLICGHSHQQKIIKDRINHIVYLNPGAAGKQGFHKSRFVLKIWVENKKITNLELISLGKR